MARTRGRPLVAGRIEPWHGLVFGIALGALATVQLALTVNVLSAALALAGLLGYVFVYTIWLKPLTPQNIVIGGAAGAVPPLVGWAAATGGLAPEALYPFGIVFLWTPPHFWALSLLIKDDYARTGVPMLPVVKGEAATRRQILAYAVVLVAFTPAPGRDRVPRRDLPRPPRSCSAPASWPSRSASCARPRGAPRCASISPRSPTWPCSSARWPRTGPSDRTAPWIATGQRGTSAPACSRRRSRSASSASRSSSRSSTSADGRRAPQRRSRPSSSTSPSPRGNRR